MLTGTDIPGIQKLRVHGNVQLRPLLCTGPVNQGEEYTDKEYAHAYMESHAVSRLAAQLYALCKQRDWSQQQLAERAGIAQERISKIENADFTSITLSTLNKLARAFDVDVRVAFESFSQGILDVVNLSPKALEVQSINSPCYPE